MPQDASRYAPDFDYDHRFHAGNVGDVLKHCALLRWLEALQAQGPVWLLDTHAGAGMYTLPPQGEWQQGIGALAGRDDAPPVAQRYLDAVRHITQGKARRYPGSPALARAQLRPQDRLRLVELIEGPCQRLEAHYAQDAQVEVIGGDGFEILRAAAQTPHLAALIDPPYTAKAEWPTLATTLIDALRLNPTLPVMAWYPIKSLMRPQTLVASLRAAGVHGACVELLTTPLRIKRKTLKGSGLLLLNPPQGVLAALSGALPWLGAALSDEWRGDVYGF
ncbi:23S rRNA (adenine(2030)-N(6))-methyltransferase RlmJ [Myxococcota bacterium]|nr:23S rRNA (adenine(2030)-N(6))-methyltransferase RlmJ [Myxococcota bacterium]